MPLTKLNFLPGLDTENTETGAEGRWVDGDKIRFRKGLPQKIGGWQKFSTTYYVGVGRALESWFSLDGSRYQSIGTDRKVYVYAAGTNQDITPIRQSNTLTSVFNTTASSANITVNHTSHGALVGDLPIQVLMLNMKYNLLLMLMHMLLHLMIQQQQVIQH
jgi:hypothetical protein